MADAPFFPPHSYSSFLVVFQNLRTADRRSAWQTTRPPLQPSATSAAKQTNSSAAPSVSSAVGLRELILPSIALRERQSLWTFKPRPHRARSRRGNAIGLHWKILMLWPHQLRCALPHRGAMPCFARCQKNANAFLLWPGLHWSRNHQTTKIAEAAWSAKEIRKALGFRDFSGLLPVVGPFSTPNRKSVVESRLATQTSVQLTVCKI